MQPRLRKLSANLALTVAALVVAFLLGELGVRALQRYGVLADFRKEGVFAPVEYGGKFRMSRNQTLGWELDPSDPLVETPGAVSVVAMPRGGGALSQALRDSIRGYLDAHRLVTTRIFVIDPDYVTIDIHATVAKTPEADADVLATKAEGTLAEFLDPEYGGDPAKAAAYVEAQSSGTPGDERGTGWPFGRSIYLSELYEVIERVRGVDHVESITAPVGAMPLEQGQLPISGTHVIQVV